MNNNAKPDENYLDGKDKWTVRFTVSDDTKINPGDYKETTQYFKKRRTRRANDYPEK